MCAGLRVGLKVTLYELATPATASSQPRAPKQAQEKGCAESAEGSQAWPARTRFLLCCEKAMCAGYKVRLRVGLKVTLYELATPATAISQLRAPKQAQEKGCAESAEGSQAWPARTGSVNLRCYILY